MNVVGSFSMRKSNKFHAVGQPETNTTITLEENLINLLNSQSNTRGEVVAKKVKLDHRESVVKKEMLDLAESVVKKEKLDLRESVVKQAKKEMLLINLF